MDSESHGFERRWEFNLVWNNDNRERNTGPSGRQFHYKCHFRDGPARRIVH